MVQARRPPASRPGQPESGPATDSPGGRRAAAGVAIAVLLLAIAVAWSMQAFDSGPELRPSPVPPAARVSGDATATGAGAASDAAANLGAVEARSDAAAAPGGRHVEILVVTEDSQPVVGATVRYMPPRPPAQHDLDEVRFDEGDHETYLRAEGRSAVSDASGRVQCNADGNTPVCARLGDLYGEGFVHGRIADGVPELIRLSRDVSLRVEVVDQAQRPVAGVFVVAESTSVCRHRGSTTYTETLGPTDAQGLATLPHLQQCMALPGPDVLAFRMDLRLYPEVPAASARPVRAEELLAPAPLRLVAPHGGVVEMRVIDADGQPYVYAAPVLADTRSDTLCEVTSSQAGRLRYSLVPLARHWRAQVGDPDAPAAIEFDGPQQPGEVVAVELRVPRRRTSLRGRLLLDGRPLGRSRVQFAKDHRGGFDHADRWVAVDEQGRFAILGSLPEHARPRRIALAIEHALVPEGARVECETVLAPGDIDLGDVALPFAAPSQPLLVVRVLADGRDVSAAAGVALYSRDREHGHRLHPAPIEPRATARGLEVWAQQPSRELLLHVSHLGYRRTVREVQPHQEIAVELQPGAELWAMLLAPTAPRDSVDVLVVPEGQDARRGTGAGERRQGQWNWSFLSPGRYRLAVELGGVIVHETETFPVVAGVNRWPPDGALRDLRHVGRIVHLGAVDADSGAALTARWFRVEKVAGDDGEDEGEGERAVEIEEWVPAAAGGPDLLVFAKGYQPMRVPHSPGDQRVPLRRMTTLRVVPAAGASETIVCLVEDAVRDRLLRELDVHEHDAESVHEGAEAFEFSCAPGSVIEVAAVVADVRRPAQRFVVGAASPQDVVCH